MSRVKSAYDDDTPMPFGKYKGDRLEDVPGGYLLYLDKQGISDLNLKAYVDEERNFLKADDTPW